MLDRDQILAATDLAALADELLGPRRGTSRSPCWSCPSPAHAQTGRTPPVSVYRSPGGEERWHCHGCGIGGSAIDLVMAASGVSVGDAIQELAGRAGGPCRFRTGDEVHALPPPRRRPPPEPAVSDPEGLAAYIEECAERLWQPAGRVVLRWLTDHRGLPEEVLRTNRIGADPGWHGQARPQGMPSAGRAVVLPVHEGDRPVFAQLRPLHPRPGYPRYLNAASRLAANPRLGVYGPAEAVGRCLVVTEGVLDALSANAAGFHAAAVLGSGVAHDPSGAVVARLAGAAAPVVLAFDADEAGQQAAAVLQQSLLHHEVTVARLHVPVEAKDLNAWMLRCPDWPQRLIQAVRAAVSAARPARTISR